MKYTDEQRGNALAVAKATSIAEASRRTGIPEQTIRDWRNGTTEIRGVKAAAENTLAAEIERQVRQMLGLTGDVWEAVEAGSLSIAEAVKLWTSIGIGVDKLRALRGESADQASHTVRVIYEGGNADTSQAASGAGNGHREPDTVHGASLWASLGQDSDGAVASD